MAFVPLHDTNPLRYIRYPWVMWSLVGINVLVYFLFEVGSFATEPTNASAVAFGLVPAYLNGILPRPMDLLSVPDGLTLVTYSFLHGNFLHLAGNMLFLWVFGDNVEDALGHVRYFVFYMLCAVVAGYGFALSDPASEAPVIGASGAVAGNIAAYVLLYPRAKVWILVFPLPLRLRVEYVLGFWIAFQLYSAFAGGDNGVAWWAHIGGLATGAVLVVLLKRKDVPLFAKALPEHPPGNGFAGPPGEQMVQAPPLNETEKGPWG